MVEAAEPPQPELMRSSSGRRIRRRGGEFALNFAGLWKDPRHFVSCSLKSKADWLVHAASHEWTVSVVVAVVHQLFYRCQCHRDFQPSRSKENACSTAERPLHCGSSRFFLKLCFMFLFSLFCRTRAWPWPSFFGKRALSVRWSRVVS